MIKKILIYGIVVFVVYKGLSFYTTYTTAEKALNCGGQFGLLQGVKKPERTREQYLLSAKAWRCVKRDQNIVEALFFKIPDTWINPPRPYVDPPFTPEELADGSGIDRSIQKDLRALAIVYEDESGSLNRIMSLLATSDKNKLGTQEIGQRYGEVSGELRSIAARFSTAHPSTRQVDEPHQELIGSLNQIASDGQELGSLFVSINKDLEETDSILALPKSEIAENRGKLLEIRDRLTRAEARLHMKLKILEKNRDNALAALDKLEALARKHGVSLST